MVGRVEIDEKDPKVHVMKIRQMLCEVATHAREDVSKVDDPKFKALFETTAEVLKGLEQAYEHAETQSEEAWR